MKKSDHLKRELDDLLSEAESLNKRQQREGREFTPQEQSRWSALMTEDTGEVAVLTKKFDDEVLKESQQARLRSMQTNLNAPVRPVYDATGAGQYAGGHNPNHGFDFGQNTISVNLRAPRLTAFRGPDAARDAYDSGLALKAVLYRDSAARDALISRRGEAFYASVNENSPVDGGFLMAPEFNTATFTAWEQTGAVIALAKALEMKSDTLTLAKQTGGTTVYYPGEEGEITPSDLDLARVTLTAKKRAILSYVSTEMNDDAIVPVMDMLATDMGHQFGLKQDQEGILGDGTSTYGLVKGIKTAMTAATAGISTCATGHNDWRLIDLNDIAACMSLIPDKFRVQGQLAWLCSAGFKWQVFDRLAINAGGAPAITFVNGQPQLMFLGIPIVLSDRCPTTGAAATIAAYLGNWGQALLLGQRTQIRIATSEHVAFTSDRVAVRATTRYDLNFHEPGSTTAAGAVVALKTAA